jgi:crossover junction endodeoxyribonuclease RusA
MCGWDLDAGVLPDDDAEHLIGPDMRLGEIHPRGRLVLTITEVPGGAP